MSPIHCKEIQITLNIVESKSKSKNTNVFGVIMSLTRWGRAGVMAQDDKHMR